MNMGIECIPCLFNQIDKIIRNSDIDDKQGLIIMKKAIDILHRSDLAEPTPHVARKVHAEIRKITGISDPYEDVKALSNANARKLLPSMREIIMNSTEPVSCAIRIAISGNIIDYGAPGGGEMHRIEEALASVLKRDLDQGMVDDFIQSMDSAKDILYIGDNSGEIFFDRLLVEQMPAAKITFAVRGGPVLNDATPDDARAADIDSLVKLISTGDTTPGIDLKRSSDEFLQALQKADMIILKGQGNLETMYGTDLREHTKRSVPLFFLFKVKGHHIATVTGMDLGDPAFIQRMSW